MKSAFEEYLKIFRTELPLDECFDLIERKLRIGGRQAVMYFVDGLHDGQKGQLLLNYLLAVEPQTMQGLKKSQAFLEAAVPFMDASVVEPQADAGPDAENMADSGTDAAAYDCYLQTLPKLYAGLVPLIVEGLDKIIILDARDYPSRSVEEPEKERTLRGARDGFTENMMENVAMIRRRLRSNQLIFKVFNVGTDSKSDVVLCYMQDRADSKFVEKLTSVLNDMKQKALHGRGKGSAPRRGGQNRPERGNDAQKDGALAEPAQRETGDFDALTVTDQSLLEHLQEAFGVANGLNPFPRVRYTQRPDVAAAHLEEGKVVLITDNSPTAMMIPVSVFEFFQDTDDYYFPQLTGNYFRFLRILNFVVILLLTPIYVLMVEYEWFTPDVLRFFVPENDYVISIFWQFMLLELAIDALKLASLNTPTSLGMSLSVIGALILGEFSISSGWFIPQTILCMAVVALASFTQPSIELSYAMKFCRVFMLIGAQVLGLGGIIAAAAISLLVMGLTKTLSGTSYLYPLIPFDSKVLKRLIFRTKR